MFVAGYSYCFSHAALRPNIVKTAMQLFGICICILQTLDQKYQRRVSVRGISHSASDFGRLSCNDHEESRRVDRSTNSRLYSPLKID